MRPKPWLHGTGPAGYGGRTPDDFVVMAGPPSGSDDADD
ncbi:hypothetical protein F4557_002245 [Actinomadura catellatispora]|uniref:Uncharacterized protein n=1 Tax=Actinomadura livida TaxID=79909 RepID=A0A7W7MXE1_9ACTN|nr:hypothetical protein [Actinomadura catellatispora]